MKHARPESDVLKVVRQDGEVLFDGNTWTVNKNNKDDFSHRPEIDREKLKSILLENLNTENVQYRKILTEAVPGPRANSWNLHFRDGSIEKDFDLIVGAEGAWSRTRKLVTDIEPVYSGISAIELWALNVDKEHPWMIDYVGKGSLFSFGEGRTIQIQRIGGDSIRTYACLGKPETFIKECGIDWKQPETAREELVEQYYSDCGTELKRMILESSDELIPRQLYMLPVGIKWYPKPGVTLLGDAAHLMTPFAGVGVNAAMLDALELARVIVSLKDGKIANLDDAIEKYERELFPRNKKFAEKTMSNMKGHFSSDGCTHLARRLKVFHTLLAIVNGAKRPSLCPGYQKRYCSPPRGVWCLVICPIVSNNLCRAVYQLGCEYQRGL